MELHATLFGRTNAGEPVHEYTLDNGEGITVRCIEYGGALTEIRTPDRTGRAQNIVLGFDDVAAYEDNPCWAGVLCGPVAGRIANAAFDLEGRHCALERNEPAASLHGGRGGFAHALWKARELRDANRVGVVFSLEQPDGHGGYPGPLFARATYTLHRDGIFSIDYEGYAEQPSLFAPTSHSYFNLSGDGTRSGAEQELRIDADRVLFIDASCLPTSVESVEGTPFDFRRFKPVGRDLQSPHPQIALGRGYDHAYILNQPNGSPQIYLRDPSSGRSLAIVTTEPAVVFYAGGSFGSDLLFRGGIRATPHLAVALETQWYPNAINAPFLPKRILRPGKSFRSHTEYRFGLL